MTTATDDLRDSIIPRMLERLHAETVKRSQVRAIKARVGGLHGRELAEALKTVNYYERSLAGAIREFYQDGDASAFIDEMVRLVEGQFRRAWNEGSRAVDVDPKDHEQEDDDELQNHIDEELEFVLDFAQGIEDARIAGDPVKPYLDRVALWTNRYNEIVNAAQIWFGGKLRLEWKLGATEEHCETCYQLNGIIATAEAWEESGFQPQGAPNDMLECGGWRCDCSLEPTKDRATPAQPKDVKPANG